jgi:drug/metabolite transporter superfamily protein YnfA
MYFLSGSHTSRPENALVEEIMTRESRMLAGILLVVLPSVIYGGLTLLTLLTRGVTGYTENPLRHDMWRAGHAHAGVYLVLSLVMLRYVDEAMLSPFWKWLARTGAPIAAILIPAAFFLSVASPSAKEPNGLLNLAYIGALFLAAAVLSLGVGLIRAARQ